MKLTEKQYKQKQVEDKLDGAIVVKQYSIVSERVWAPGDTYLVVGEVQVMEHEGFKRGDWVEVTIKKVTQEEALGKVNNL